MAWDEASALGNNFSLKQSLSDSIEDYQVNEYELNYYDVKFMQLAYVYTY